MMAISDNALSSRTATGRLACQEVDFSLSRAERTHTYCERLQFHDLLDRCASPDAT